MKIEKVNENQIRCTLTKQDLADRQLNLRELAYGSDKAKGLFHDMIQQANYEFGFETNDIPLMVEAIPLSTESLVLLITKVEYPDELDTRFSKFSETDADELFENYDLPNAVDPKGADDILGLFNKLREAKADEQTQPKQDFKVPEESVQLSVDLTKMFEFDSLEQVERLSHTLSGYYTGQNDLYKDERKNRFYLTVHKNDHTPEEFNRICNIICEYALQKNYTPAVGAYFAEHGKKITGPWALQMLASL
jgi:adapter protein MecA 1/2